MTAENVGAQAKNRNSEGAEDQPEPTRHIQYRQRAALDLESIIVYIGETCAAPKAAKQLYESITEALDNLRAMPTLGRVFQDDNLECGPYRSWLVGNYRIFYTYDEKRLTVWRIIHTRQDITDATIENTLGI